MNDSKLIGATLQLLDSNDVIVDEWVTDGKEHRIYAIPLGTYTLREVKAPTGYTMAADMEIIIDGTSKTHTFTMKDDPIQLEIYKIDSATNKNLVGATLQLLDDNGDIVEEWVTNEEPHRFYAIPVGAYTLREVKAPRGYALATDMEIIIDGTSKTHTYTMRDDPIQLEIYKIDSTTKKNLVGATLQLLGSMGNVIEEWITDEEPHSFYKLPAGTYILREIEAPKGYALAQDMVIEVKAISKVQQVTMVDVRMGGIITSLSNLTYLDEGLSYRETKPSSPKTGDSTKYALYIGGMLVAAAMIVVSIGMRIKHGKDKKATKKK